MIAFVYEIDTSTSIVGDLNAPKISFICIIYMKHIIVGDYMYMD